MYNEHFGFVESPFTATANSRFFYSNDLYQEAFANLRYGIEWKKGLIVMTGEVGTGKTTLLCKMMRSLKPTTH
ncbi:MAG: AAA family ATPase, partial [Verrucomicrobia bacterium]